MVRRLLTDPLISGLTHTIVSIKPTLLLMNHRCLEMSWHYENGPGHCMISMASKCSKISILIHES